MAFVLPLAGAALSSIGIGGAAAGSAASLGAEAAGGIGSFLAGAAPTAAAASPWLADVSLGSTVLGGVTGAYGAISSANASAASAKFNSAVDLQNSLQAKQNAAISSQAGAEQTAIQQQKTRALVGSLKANQAASGLDVNSGSDTDVRSSAAELGELDALTVRSNATREAYGYTTQAENFKEEGSLAQIASENDKSGGLIQAGSTLLGSAGTAATNWAKYQLQGGFSG